MNTQKDEHAKVSFLITKMISQMISSALLAQSPRQLYFPLWGVTLNWYGGNW
jgi:hypothetical protein